MLQNRWVRSLVGLVAAAMVAAGCSGAGDDSAGTVAAARAAGTGPTAEGASSPEARTASDAGITADAIHVGILSGDLRKLVQIGFASDIGEVRSLYETFLLDVNAKGGINGRNLTWSYQEFDFIGGEPEMQRACTELFKAPTFAVIASDGYSDGMPCVTTEHKTPVLAADPFPVSAFAAAGGNLFSIPPSTQVSAAAMVELLAQSHALDGKTLGVVYGDRAGMAETVDTGLEPALAKLGKTLVKAQVTGSSAEPGTLAQIDPTIRKLKNAKVDGLFVFEDAFFGTNLLSAAYKAGYRPQLFGSDYQRMADAIVLPFISTYQAEPALNGMLGTTYTRVGEDTAGRPADPADDACVTRYAAGQGRDVPAYGSQRWSALVRICQQLDVFVQGLKDAGANPTRAGFRDALTARATMHIGFGTKGSFGPGKPDAANEFRIVRYDGATNHFVPVTEFAPAGR
jgi:ABC-type branched-subunit amino acid transport system substrate-binding protein